MPNRAIIYYGNGSCSIENGVNVRGIQIWYKGNIEVIDQTPNGYEMMIANNQIIIFAINPNIDLSDLFNYKGHFEITRLLVADNEAKAVASFAKRVLDYSELLQSKAEDLTIKAEDISAGYVSEKEVGISSLNTPIMENLNTASQDGSLYLSDGTEFHGYFHLHKEHSGCMTGATHGEGSEDLYYYREDELLPTKNISHIPPANKILKEKRNKRLREESKGFRRKKREQKSIRKNKNRSSGRSGGGY